jgi:hypothetical protein
VSFRSVVEKTRDLRNAWKVGLGALRAQDKPHIEADDTRQLGGSVDVDAALQQREPHAYRWDFAIAYRHTNRSKECVYWVEIHTANEKEVKVVLKKLSWLKSWLAHDGELLAPFERDFIWVSSGPTSFTADSPQVKRLAQQGLQHKGRVLRIPAKRPA